MTVASYALGKPRPAASRGGDCRIFDVTQDRHVGGAHHFASPSDCRIENGLLRLTLGVGGSAPSLSFDVRRGRVTVGDTYIDTYTDTYGGSIGTPVWLAGGTFTIDSPSVSAVLSGVRVVSLDDESVTIRIMAPLMGDAYVTLRRGERMIHIQHGRTRLPLVDIDRRVRLTASPSPVGYAAGGRVEEPAPKLDGLPRWVAAIDPVTVTAGTFSITASSVTTCRFGAGVGTYGERDQPIDQHRQLGNSSRPVLVVS